MSKTIEQKIAEKAKLGGYRIFPEPPHIPGRNLPTPDLRSHDRSRVIRMIEETCLWLLEQGADWEATEEDIRSAYHKATSIDDLIQHIQSNYHIIKK